MGHINPTLSLGECLLAKGYRVIWISEKKELNKLLPVGGESIEIEGIEIENNEKKDDEISFTNNSFGMQSIQKLYERGFIPRNEKIYRQLQQVGKSLHIDYIITDQQAFSGALYAHVNNIPFAVSVTTPATIDPSIHFPEVLEYEKSQVLDFQHRMGCKVPEALVWHSPVTLIYTTKEFLQKENFPAHYYFVGPSINYRRELNTDLFLSGKENRIRPLVLVSMGATIPCESEFVEKIIQAFATLDVDVVLVANPEMKTGWPKNFHVFSYIPQLRVLEVVDLVVCHAGHNTVVEALNKGIPILAIPIVHDQSFIAGKIVDAGAGLRLKYKRLNSNQIENAVKQILINPKYRLAAQKIQKSFEHSGGGQRAAKIIESHIHQVLSHPISAQ